MTPKFLNPLKFAAMVACTLGAASALATPVPTLTAAGIAKGFTLDTVVAGLPSSNGWSYDVLGSSINSDGNIIVNNAATRTNYVFKNVNNQTTADALSSTAFGGFASAFAYSGGSVWATANGGRLTKLNNDGSVNTTYNGICANQGLWTNPANGHLIANCGGLYDINVSGATPVSSLITNNFSADGLTVSPDGKYAYGSYGDIIDLVTKTKVGSFGYISGADGMGVITSSNADLNGDLIVSTTGGEIWLVDTSAGYLKTLIARGGGYGDYTSPDYSTGTLLVSSSNNLLRLGCGAACGIGSKPVDTVPEPASLALVALGLVGMAARRRRS